MKRFFVVFLFLASALNALAQESSCGNGIDDDGDGFIDCFDSDCANSVSCKDFYVGRDKACQVPPSGTAKFEMKLGQTSPDRATWSSGRMAVGDLDADGIPEMITLHQDDKKLYILDGRTFAVKYTGSITGTAEYFDHIIGNVKKDNCADIFIAEKDGSTFYITSYDCKGVQQWRKAIYGQPVTMGLADFDEDGKVELYYRNEILDAETGTRLVKGSGNWTTIDAGPVAVDILDNAACTACAGLELVLGGNIYAVDLGTRAADAGTLSLAASIPAAANYYPKNTSFGWVTSLTSVADYNQDGFLDVLTSGATGSTGGTTTVFFWDVKNSTYKTYQPSNNWKHGTGRLNIGDIDGDGKSNATFVSGNRLFALKDDFTLLWQVTINEGTSGYTGTTVFDFNNDKAVEIVYRDESYLYIINGKTGGVFTQQTCRSRTANDYPIVVDVDADGSTEICVICATNNSDDINDINRAPYGQVRAYESNLEAWVPARKVWNQHGYFNVNVNDDLSIPQVQQKHHLVFSTGSCTTGANRALNTFLNQSPFLDSKGCPTYASPDVTYDAASVKITPPTCPDQNFTVSMDIKNIGDLGISGTLPITFYQGNPTQAGAVKLNTVNVNLANFNVGNTVSLSNLSVQGTGSTFTLYVVLNDNGTTTPTPIKLPNSTFSECNYTNNIVSAGVTPTPFTIQTALISNNIKCGTGTTTPNGAAEAYRMINGVKTTTGYTFYWFDGTTAADTSLAVFKGPVRTGLAAGTYTIIAYHKGVKCGSTAAQVVVGEQTRTLVAEISLDKPYTNCKNPDGKLTVLMNGGDPVGNYTYQWFEGNVFGTSPVLSTSHVITNVSAVTYSVLVTEKSTGCQILESAKVEDKTVKPVVSATTTLANCNPAASGSASANVGGNTNKYDFKWYNGGSVKPTADFSGSTYNNIAPGDYTVTATEKSGGCTSAPLVVTVSPKQSVPVTTTVLTHQTSCTVSNGSASAAVSGTTTGYTFKWFRGNNTLAANQIGTTSAITGLSAGVYTVEATSTATGCSDTEIVTINDNIVTPAVTANVTSHQTNCTPTNGAVSATGAGGTPFTYYWFNGNVGTPDTTLANFKGAAYTGLAAGFYTVVAVNKSTRCSSSRALVEVLNNTVAPVITTSTIDQTSCNAATPNGQASANVGGVTAGYKFRWFTGADTTTFITQAPSITNRAAGTYTVKAVNTTTRCFSTTQVTIAPNLVNPVVTNTIVNNSNCAGVTPNGSVTIRVNGGTNPITDFTIQWYEGNGTTTPLGTTVGNTSGTNKETAQGLSAGTYTVRVTDNVAPGNACSTVASFTVGNTLATLSIDAADIALTHQSNCSPVNGAAIVNEITVNGTGTGNTTGYTFTWYQSNGTTVIPGSGTSASIGVALAAGNYFVKATNTTTNCSTALTPFTINDTHVNPAITAATLTNNTNCTGITPNGLITININGVAPVAGQFTIEWFEGNGTTTVLGTTVGSVSGASNQTAQNLTAGAYTVRVTDILAPSTGCVTITTFNIIDAQPPTIIDAADLALTHQSDCTPLNGSATVNEITVNGTGLGNTTGYTFAWYQSNGTTIIPGSGTSATIGVALAAGNYFVKATNTTTNCATALRAFTINDTHLNPAITAATLTNNTNCNGITPNGLVTINVNGAAPAAGQFTIEWFEGNGTTTPLGTTAGSVTGASNETAQNLPAGTYTVRVTDIIAPGTGCVTTTTFNIIDAQPTIAILAADVALTHQSNCSPLNGSATVNEITVNGTGLGNTTGYTFTWYQSNGTTVVPGAGTSATIGVALAAGSYFVKATNTATNCSTPLTAFTINDAHVNPVVTAATLTNNTNCAGITPNGLITINIDGAAPAAGQFTIEWFEGNGTTTTLGTTAGSVSGASNQTAQDLKAGTYTVRVTDTNAANTGCVTITTFNITDAPATITIVPADITLTHQSNCNPVNGSATVNEITVNGSGIGNTTGYTFTWYQSDGTTVIPGSGNLSSIGVALTAGSYFVRATNTSTNCSTALAGFTINDTHVNPVVAAATLTNNTNCVGVTPNGVITINVDGAPPVAGQHNVEWFEGNGTTTTLGTTVGSVSGVGNQTAQNLKAGTYTVRVTDINAANTGCVTITTFNITDSPATITIDAADIALTHQSNCSPVNGSATVNEITVNGAGIGNTTGYTFTWYQSNGTTVIPGAGNSASIGVALASGSYFVKATNTATNCSTALAGFTINDTHVNPIVTAATLTNNTNCIGATPNGLVTLNINGAAPAAGEYTIEWFEGNGTTTPLGTTVGTVSGVSNETAQNLKAGTYTVRVTDATTPNAGCVTITTFSTTDAPATYTIDPADITLTHQSNCTPVNGSATISEITVNGAGIGNTTGYTFTWYQSNGTTVIPGSGNTATIGVALTAGSYFVRATNTTTSCVTALVGFTIDDTHVNPVIALAAPIVDNINCAGTPGGSITIQINGGANPLTDFTIAWFEGNGTTVPLGTTVGTTAGVNNETAQGLRGGTYTVRVTDNTTPGSGCSAIASFSVADNFIYPVVNSTPQANTACDPLKSNGVITADVGGVTAGYDFHIFRGQNTLAANEVTTGVATATGLAAGVYTVQAINTITGCAATTEVSVADNIVLPTITMTASTNVTSCFTPNGTASVTGVSIGALADYTFSWYRGNAIKAAADFTGATITGLTAGNYTVTATNNILGCDVLVPVTVTVNDDPSILITINELPFPEKVTPAICNDGLGQIAASASSPANAAGFTFSWFLGDKNIGLTAEGAGVNFGVNSNRISQAASGELIVSGLHTVIALDNTTGCQDSLVIHLPYSDEAALLSILTTPQTDCLNPDGGFEATITPSAGTVAAFPAVDQSWYELRVYQNGALIASAPGVEPAPTILAGLAAGNYTVLAVETHPSLPGCSSAPNDVNIADNTVYPVIAANTLTDNKNCVGATEFNGSISLTIDGTPTPGAGYTYVWHDGKLTTDPTLPAANVMAPGHTATKIDGGFYTVEVTNAKNCKAKETLYLNNTPYIISIPAADLDLTAQTDCSPGNGSAEVTNVLLDGANSAVAGYTFDWFLNDGTTVIPSSTNAASVGTPIAAGTYFVQATNNINNCESPLVQFVINDASLDPVISLSAVVDNSNCAGAPANGSITINIDGAAPVAGNHTIQWYTGTGLGAPIAGATSATLANLAAGDYTVEVTDILSPGNSCSSTMTFTIVDDLPVITIPVGSITVTNQTDCVANGTAQVTDILIDGVSNGGTAGFTFEWFNNLGASIDGPGSADVVGVALGQGDYSVVATNTASQCISIASTFTVNDVSVTPVIALSALADNTNCSGAPANGSITITIDGAAPVAGNHTIQWYTGMGTSAPIAGATSATLANLAAGDYTVEVTDILSPGNTCSSVMTFTVIDDLPVITIPVASITVTDQTDCVANGTAQVTDILIDGVSNGGTAGFTFEWFDNVSASIDGPGSADVVGVALGQGDYSVVATNTASQCISIASTFTVNDVSVTPVIASSALVNNTNCSGAPANGSITITIDGAAPVAGSHTIQWYTGMGTSAPIAGATSATLPNLAAGDYTVEVIDILSPGNTCSSTTTFTVVDDLPVITIPAASITVTDQTDCVANGTAQVTDILIDGVSNGGAAGFTFEWFDNVGASIDGPGASNVVGVALGQGDYSVVATSTASQCISIASTFTVNDVSVTPVIALSALVDNTNCSGAPANGSITITIDGAAPVAGNHTIQWYTGMGTSAPIAGATSATLANLAGDYTVEVTDILSPGNTCSSVMTFTVIDDLPVITIPAASITVTDQTDCVANGTAQVTDILIDGVSNGGTAGFTFEWSNSLGASIDGPGASNVVGVALGQGDYSVVATNTASQCISIASTFTVNDVSVTPVIASSALVNNTNCSGAPANGSITITIDGTAPVAGNHTIQWYTGMGTNAPIVGATSATLANLAAGDYTVEVTDILSPGNTCSGTMTFTVVDDLNVITIPVASIAVTDQTDCVANGTAQVTDIFIDGVSNGGTAGFTFEWFNSLGASIDGPGASNVVGVALSAGDYRVVATSTASQCTSISSTFWVNDVSVTPVITLNALTNNTNCIGAAANGSITINVNGGIPAATEYGIQWFTGVGTTTSIAGATSATLASLGAGDYTVEVTDIQSPGNTCSSTAVFTILESQNVIGIYSTDLSITDNSNCQPTNGSATVMDIIFNGNATGNTAGYTFEWLQSDQTPVDPGNLATVGVALTANNYYVRATHVASNCISPLTPFAVEDISVIPVLVAVTEQDNIACNASYTGQVSASVSEGFTNGITAGYSFEWFNGANNTNPADLVSNGAVLTGLQDGDYTVRVRDISSPSNDCANTVTVTVNRDIVVLNGQLTAIAQTVCAPIQDGNITVNSVDQFLDGVTTVFNMSNAADRSKFSFQWFDENLVPVSPVVNGNNVSPNLEEGTFYVQITDALGCSSDYIQSVIDDQTTKPTIALDEFLNPAVCILPEVRGSLFVSVDNHANYADYTVDWYEGNSASGPVISANNPLLNNIAYTSPDEYTVRVTNNTTQCFSLETYKFTTDTVAIQVVASAVPLTSCVTDNGSLFAATRTGSGQLYNIEWYIGEGVGTTPDFTTNEVLVAPIGTYTAVAKHPTLNFCTSISDTVSVTDGRVYPVVAAMQKAALTYCDPSNPNGAANATVNGGIIGYTFDWYENALTNPSIYTGSEATALKATTYIVKATDVISGCTGTTSITIENDPLTTPVPQITVLSNRTDCTVLDGALSADVNGVTSNYDFSWYIGASVKQQKDGSGEIFSGLDAGTYTVTATDRITGCTSNGVQQDIVGEMLYPVFDIKTVATACDSNNGTAEVHVSGAVEVIEVQWDIQGVIEFGPQISNLPAGTFTVTAISSKNCGTSETFEVKTDIAIYNAISKNNDGLNDIFEIGCIDDFPNNRVKVFNRAGTLVYEAGGYNNGDVSFNGVSNRGVNIMGNDLPDGTYFYIVDKGDGSEPRTGYLELLH